MPQDFKLLNFFQFIRRKKTKHVQEQAVFVDQYHKVMRTKEEDEEAALENNSTDYGKKEEVMTFQKNSHV